MGDHQVRLGAVNLGQFVGVHLNLWLIVLIAVSVLTRTLNESTNQSQIDLSVLAFRKTPINQATICVELNWPVVPFIVIYFINRRCNGLRVLVMRFSMP